MYLAEQRYTSVWKRFRTYLIKSDYSCSLSKFCRLTGTNYNGMCHWLCRHEFSVPALKNGTPMHLWKNTGSYFPTNLKINDKNGL